MDKIKLVLRLLGLSFIPVAVLLLSAVIWQNNSAVIAEFALIGGWWKLENILLIKLLIWFFAFGVVLCFAFFLLLQRERKLSQELQELRRLKGQHRQTSKRTAKTMQQEPGPKEHNAEPLAPPSQTKASRTSADTEP